MEETIRAFVAIELSDEIKRSLASLIARLQKTGLNNMRWVNPDSVHLTLKFLGNISTSRVNDVTAVLSRCASGAAPFALTIGKLGAFPNSKAPRVLWIGLEGELAALDSLQRCVEGGLQNLGFGKEDHPFSPHLTLARVQNHATSRDRQNAGEALVKAALSPEVSMTVTHISLMKSNLTPAGAIHSRLAHIKLG